MHETSPLGSRVTFSGTVANLQAAFRSEMRRYEVHGEMHFAMSSPPSVPSELADVVLDVTHTHDFYPRPAVRRGPNPGYAQRQHDAGFAPPDWANVL